MYAQKGKKYCLIHDALLATNHYPTVDFIIQRLFFSVNPFFIFILYVSKFYAKRLTPTKILF